MLLVQYNERFLDGPPFIPSAYRKDRFVELNFRTLPSAKGIHEEHVVRMIQGLVYMFDLIWA